VKQFFEFVVNHWMLWSLFGLTILVILFEEVRGRIQGVARVQPAELTSMINRDGATVIDVRDSNAYLKGHIIGSINIPHTQIDASLDKIKQYQDKPIVLVCALGQTSPQEGAKLKKKMTGDISFLSGGIKAWQQAGLPLTKD
jgi:rhodanese-related sulfurtransferase